MHIGVFGDSFAMMGWENGLIWWRLLEQQFGHKVTSHGQAGSSIEYSAELIDMHYKQYDFMIWCLSWPGRHSIKTEDGYYHTGNLAGAQKQKEESNLDTKINICIDYSNHIHDRDSSSRIYRAASIGFLQQYPNLMIIPCFNYPLATKFDLFSLSVIEMNYFFPGVPFLKVFSKYQDTRPAHLTLENNKILAQLINDNLKPGIFQTEYNNFPTPTGSFEGLFKIHP